MNTRERRLLTLILSALVLAASGCTTDDDVDDPDGAPVSLEVRIHTNPPVTTQQDPAFGCLFTVQEWTATAFNVPKNGDATTSPFNDILLDRVEILYAWDGGDPAGFNPPVPRVVPLLGAVPANGSITFSYTPIFLDDVSSALEGRTAALTMTFHARTVAGEPISFTTGETLSVNACASLPPPEE
jgi:hypothetical protein